MARQNAVEDSCSAGLGHPVLAFVEGNIVQERMTEERAVSVRSVMYGLRGQAFIRASLLRFTIPHLWSYRLLQEK